MRACPECNKRTKKDGPPTLSPGGFLDQRIGCGCGWCGVESEPVNLSRLIAEYIRDNNFFTPTDYSWVVRSGEIFVQDHNAKTICNFYCGSTALEICEIFGITPEFI